jgi:hypothetical protein
MMEPAGIRLIPIDRTGGMSPFGTATRYAIACPACGRFADLYRDERGWWSACRLVADVRHPIDDLEFRIRLRAAA